LRFGPFGCGRQALREQRACGFAVLRLGQDLRRRRRRGGVGLATAGPDRPVDAAGSVGSGGGVSAGRVTVSSRSAASARCSACGRDTSRARMAVDSVILVIGMYASVA
jgi:hypothetical protein